MRLSSDIESQLPVPNHEFTRRETMSLIQNPFDGPVSQDSSGREDR